MRFAAVLTLVLTLALMFTGSAHGQPVVGGGGADRGAEFERRYGFAQWQGKDRVPLRLTHVDPGVSLPDMPLGTVGNAFEPSFGRSRSDMYGHVEILLWPMDGDARKGDESPLGVRIRMFESAAAAQRALMDQLASTLVSRSPAPGDGPAYGESWIDGVGDVCLAHPIHAGGYGRLDCVESNVWLTLQLARPLEVDAPKSSISQRMVDVATSLVARLRDADAESRRASSAPQRVELQKAAYDADGKLVITDERPTQSIAAAPGSTAALAIHVRRDGDEPEESVHRAESTAGSVRYVLDPDHGTSSPVAVALGPDDAGPQKVFHLIQHPDGVFEFSIVPFEVLR